VSTISVDYDVLNQKGSPAWFSDTFANIPTFGFKGRMFISIDTFAFYRDTGTGWDLIGGPGIGTLTGSGTTGQVSFFNGTQVLTGNNNLFWDNTNSRLGINTTTPGVALDIHATGTNAQFNGTGTSNAYLAFQNAGASKWRIGNTYNAGANSFDIYNVGLTTTILSISSTTNTMTLATNVTTTGAQFVQNGFYLSNANAGSQAFYTNMWGSDDGINFGLRNGTGGASFIFQTPGYAYTFPASAGTLALTSNLSSYLPLAGGTLTGALIGTSAAFTGEISTSGGQLAFSGSTGGQPSTGVGIRYNGTFYLYPGANGFNVRNSANSLNTFVVTDSGSATLGSSSANATLTIYGDTGSGDTFLSFNADSAQTKAQIQGTKFAGTGGQLIFKTLVSSVLTEAMRISYTGNIIMGSTTDNNLALLEIKAPSAKYGMRIYAPNSSGNCFGLWVDAGSTSADKALLIRNQSGSINLFSIRGDNYINVGTGSVAPYNYSTSGRSAVLEADGSFGYLVSTRESKENIKPIISIDFINQLNPVQFNYRKKDLDTNTFTDKLYENITFGFIADEVEKVNKDLVFYNSDNTLAGVEYNGMIAILTKAIQELNEKLVRNNIN
jgi:hypothetical protein